MIFSFLFDLFFIFATVTSFASSESIPRDKSDNEIKKELFSNIIQEKDIPSTLDNDSISNSNIIESGILSHHGISDDDKDVLVTNDKSKISESLILKEMKDDPFLIEILNSLPMMPTVLIDIIGGYSKYHDQTIDEYYDRIKRELSTVSRKVIPDLYDPNFTSHLLEMVRDNKEKFPNSHQFWNDLYRFLFKYALSMRKIFANDNAPFKESVKNIKDIMIIINGKIQGVDLDSIKL